MLNTCILMGRIVHTPELKTTQSGTSVVNFTLAVERGYVAKGQERETDFIDCVAWRNTAEFIAKYFAKGQLIAVVGEFQTRSYEDKQGNKRKAVEVNVSQASFTGDRRDLGGAPQQQAQPAPATPAAQEPASARWGRLSEDHYTPKPGAATTAYSSQQSLMDTDEDLPF